MPRLQISLAASVVLATAATFSIHPVGSAAAQLAGSALILHAARESPSDLELGGELAGLPLGSTRYLTRKDLLGLAQVSYTVTDDPNFKEVGPVRASGVSLEELAKRFAMPRADLIVAISSDEYRVNYPPDYRMAHHPFLVLTINGKGPADWPKDQGSDMGPYMISHPEFTPRFKLLAHQEARQIPWGVVRIDFCAREQVFGGIAPRGPHANDRDVKDGYRIARENCFRCHNAGQEGGHKAGVGWTVISAIAANSPDFFAGYVQDPKSKNPQAKMPASPAYDKATLDALAAYFRTFAMAGGAE